MQKVFTKRSAKGFSLVELLAVVLILAVLAAVAVPLYINTRRASAARACKANITAIAAAESAYVLRNGTYATMAQLTATGPESLSGEPKCPLSQDPYKIITGTASADYTAGTATASGDKGPIWIKCINGQAHQDAVGDTTAVATGGASVAAGGTLWDKPMAKIDSALDSDSTP